MPILCFSRRCVGRWPSRIFYGAQPPPENHFDSNQIRFYSKLSKVFPLAEFQAKLFLTRSWVGGFYRDSLLKSVDTWICKWDPNNNCTMRSEKNSKLLWFGTAVEFSGHGTADAHSNVDSLSSSGYDSTKSSSSLLLLSLYHLCSNGQKPQKPLTNSF